MEKHTKIRSFSIRKTTLKVLDEYFVTSGKRSQSELVGELLDFALEQKRHQPETEAAVSDGVIPEGIYLKWHKSLYFNTLRHYLYTSESWFEVTLSGIRMYDESEEHESLVDKLRELYGEIVRKRHIKSPQGLLLARIFMREIRKDKIKILAVRIKATQSHIERGIPVCSFVYAVTLVDVKSNTDSKDHFYLDYHSIQVFDLREVGRSPLRTLVAKKKKLAPINYMYWMPVSIFQNKMLVIGVKKRSLSDNEISLVKAEKVIMVNTQEISKNRLK
ncbi:CopG family transcriptional regulator [Serratia sp. JSRIV002]|nr:CopG family transcriptional regulator [Serratia sp. JSRIV002]UAN60180.1 CopG family transcriptional regulator [Serratia sp. JSRIV004]